MDKRKNGALILIVCLILNFTFNIKVLAKNNEELKKVVLIDAGHGGIDGGAKAKDGTLEKDINLSIALKLKESLEKKGYTIYMTREADSGLYEKGKTIKEKKREDLNNRAKLKEKTNCDIFISIHENMFPQSTCKGAQVWYASNEESKTLAELLQEVFKIELDNNNNRLAKAAENQYRILRGNYKGASVIVECGFLSNNEELNKLKDSEYQQKLAETMTKAIEKFFSQS
ncbi:N-acetylmuramoyl-L-alanine amidase CwlD [Clostridium tarantellae]|uniref:N-acetylmuramoyl-L-alanine amidase CwlD n=1 Tax=Clostridium tarantellae TaxID=39493 RepID=A0A6I1MLZ3_9CLOT|nr:N-acetylmuramoyl-L-alanine amidase CwlD [Clostridium tarantellae]MPQ43763.1 N-acetylmuramoyl-L-alanine amidase CwlD [Clostridium tarantellae]